MQDLLVVDDRRKKFTVHEGKMRTNRFRFYSPGIGDPITCPVEG